MAAELSTHRRLDAPESGRRPDCCHRLMRMSDSIVEGLLLRGKIGADGDILFEHEESFPGSGATTQRFSVVPRGRDGLMVTDDAHFAGVCPLTRLQLDDPAVREAVSVGASAMIVGGQLVALRRCRFAKVDDVCAAGGLKVLWEATLDMKIKQGSIVPSERTLLAEYREPSSSSDSWLGPSHPTAVYEPLSAHPELWRDCCVLAAIPPASFQALRTGSVDSGFGSDDKDATTIRLALHSFASAGTVGADVANAAFFLAARLEAGPQTFEHVVLLCQSSPNDASIVLQALRYGADHSGMDEDARDCLDALESLQAALGASVDSRRTRDDLR